MTKILTLLMLALVAFNASAQEYKNRVALPDEERKLAGLRYWIADNAPRFSVYQNYVGEGQNITANDTNYLFVFRSAGELTNCVLVLPNPTNNPHRLFEVINVDNVRVTVTNNPVSTFTGESNYTASVFIIQTNKSARFISTGTNWIGVLGAK
jgi:hypothetical protein